jgi:hypothetical protein
MPELRQRRWSRTTGVGSDLRNCDRRRCPFVDCMPTAAIEALCCGVLRTTVRTDSARFERVERLSTLSAFPIRSNWGSCVAGRTCESRATWELGHPQKSLGLFKPGPAVHCHEDGNRAQPRVLSPDCKSDERDGPKQAKNGRSHQAPGAAKHKPEQRSQNLTAIQGIDRKDVEDEEPLVNKGHPAHEVKQIRCGSRYSG